MSSLMKDARIRELEYLVELQQHAIQSAKDNGQLIIRYEASMKPGTLAVTTDTLASEKQRSYDDGWIARHEFYLTYQKPVEKWLYTFKAKLGFLKGVLSVSFGQAQSKAIHQISGQIAELLHDADVINRIWLNQLNLMPIDVSAVQTLRNIMAEIESDEKPITTLIEFFQSNPFDEDQLMVDVMEAVSKATPGRKEDAVVSRISSRANQLRPIDAGHKRTWKQVYKAILSEWQERILSGKHDSTDVEILNDLKSRGEKKGARYIERCWRNRYL